MATLPGINVNLTMDSAQFEATVKRVANNGGTMSRGFSTAALALKSFAAGLGASLSVAGIVAVANASIRTADNLLTLSKQTGVSVEHLQAFQRLALLSGSSAETMNRGLLNLAVGVGQLQAGTGRLGAQLAKLDPELKRQLETVTDQESAIRLVAEAMQRAGSEAGRQAIAVAVFREAGRELGVAFSEGAAGIDKGIAASQRMGEISTKMAEEAARAANEMDRLATIVKTNLASAFLAAAPQIEGLAYLMSRMAIATRDFFDELNARGTTALNFQIAELNEQLAKLHAQQESMPGFLSWVNQNEINQLTAARDELVRQRDALDEVAAASETATPKLKPLATGFVGVGEGAGTAAGEVDKLVGAQKRLQDAGLFLTETSAQEERIAAAQEQQAAMQKTAAASQEFTQDLQEQLSIQQLLLTGIDKESEQYRIHVAMLDAKRRLGRDLTAEERRMVELLEQQSSAIDEQTKFTEAIEGIWASPAQDFPDQDAAVALLEEILSCR